MNSPVTDTGNIDADNRPWFVKLRTARFTRLLIALSFLLFIAPFVGALRLNLGRTLATLMIIGLLAIVLIAAAATVSQSRRQSRMAVIFAATCLLFALAADQLDSSGLTICQYVLTICFLAFVIRLIVAALFEVKVVDYDTIAASISGYLLIGVLFAVVYSLGNRLIEDKPFILNGANETSAVEFDFGGAGTATSLYFSFVTLTTLGYGDFTPTTMPARMLTMAEAIIGQLYLVVLIARLVGLHISNEMLDRRSRSPGADPDNDQPYA